jgi:hypothetical protein
MTAPSGVRHLAELVNMSQQPFQSQCFPAMLPPRLQTRRPVLPVNGSGEHFDSWAGRVRQEMQQWGMGHLSALVILMQTVKLNKESVACFDSDKARAVPGSDYRICVCNK